MTQSAPASCGLLGSLPLPAFKADAGGIVVDCNDKLSDLLCLSRDKVIGRPISELFPLAVAQPGKAEVEGRVRVGGRLRDVVVHRSDPVSIVVDVTDRRRAERDLAESEARFVRLVELTREGLILHHKGIVVDVNPSFCRMVGWERDALIGRPYSVVVAPEHVAVAERRVREGSSEAYCMDLLRRDGSKFPAEIIGRNLVYKGKHIRAVAVRDITQEVAAERALAERELMYRQMFETNQAIKLLIDPESGIIVDANQAAEQFYGWSPAELRAMRITDINVLPPDEVKAEMARARAEDRLYFRFRHRRASGEIRNVEVYSGPVTYHGRTLLHSIIHDVTDRHRYLAELERKTEALERSNADLEQFAYVASHDLQEPLRTVVSYLQLLERRYKGQLGGDADEFIGFAVDGAKRMGRLIRDLLEYSRVETQGRALTPVDCAQAVDMALDALALVIADSGAEITVGPMPHVRGDRSQLVSLFQNLIGNAVKYRHPGRPPRISVTARRDGDEWHFQVRDNGIGIAPEYHDRIFMIFQRLHGPGRYDGTGIGLAVVKRIIVRHGGRVGVESVEGEGSCFWFTLAATDAGAALCQIANPVVPS
ncbi:MAG TPA: PAS domain S-box protein [Candidatus Omnitrophota bacterium]|nr:PAS domain S-box protein [Candidatus Omnitrophota bacterium]